MFRREQLDEMYNLQKSRNPPGILFQEQPQKPNTQVTLPRNELPSSRTTQGIFLAKLQQSVTSGARGSRNWTLRISGPTGGCALTLCSTCTPWFSFVFEYKETFSLFFHRCVALAVLCMPESMVVLHTA